MKSATTWSWQCDSNTRPADYESAALPTELYQHLLGVFYHIKSGKSTDKVEITMSINLLPLPFRRIFVLAVLAIFSPRFFGILPENHLFFNSRSSGRKSYIIIFYNYFSNSYQHFQHSFQHPKFLVISRFLRENVRKRRRRKSKIVTKKRHFFVNIKMFPLFYKEIIPESAKDT